MHALAHPGADHAAVPLPGPRWGPYPQRREAPGLNADARPRHGGPSAADRLAALRADLAELAGQDNAAFDRRCAESRRRLAYEGFVPRAVDAALALSAEAARRTLGLEPFDGQLLAAMHMLDQRLVEMATGEGKSLATALAAATAALSGAPVHVLTVNDYLVERDARAFAPLYHRLGLAVATVTAPMTDAARRSAYAAPVVLVTARELVFDYLRDRRRRAARADGLAQRAAALAAEGAAGADAGPVLRGLCIALVDEADSVLIDEAQMPLILSREHADPAARAYLWQAWQLSARLQAGQDFLLDRPSRAARLSQNGCNRLDALAQGLPGAWRSRRHRDHAVCTALAARHLYQRDRDYAVQARPGKPPRIVIIDEHTGRLADGRRWSRGLHQMVALKEDVPLGGELQTLDQLTFQCFFRRYHRLGGLSGTLGEARAELLRLYGLPVVAVAPRRACRRQVGPHRVFAHSDARWHAVQQRCAALVASGRPVLVGTDSVLASRALSAVLTAAGLPHAVLDAHQDEDEAALVARAGRAGAITVATRMAGRGTDIVPDAAALQAGGLHVLSCQLNPSQRLDRQLAGRAARQGQPGSTETWLALDAERWQADAAGRCIARLLQPLADRPLGRLGAAWCRLCHAALQRLDDARRARARLQRFRHDRNVERGLPLADHP